MFLEHQHFDLANKPILQRFKFKTPLKLMGMEDEACFIMAVDGSASIYSRTNMVEVDTDYAVLAKCGKYINKWNKINEDGVSEAIIVRFYPNIMKKIYNESLPKIPQQSKIQVFNEAHRIKLDLMMKSYVQSLLFYFETPSLMTEELIELKLKELVLLLLNSERAQEIISILKSLFNNEEYTLKQIIEAHLFEDLMIEDFASLSNMSLSSFHRKFKKIFKNTPNQYIFRKRLEKAESLVKNSAKNMNIIAYECGFGDPAYFTKAFKKVYNLSPVNYRKKHGKN